MYEKAHLPTKLRFLKRKKEGNIRAPKKQGREKTKCRAEARSLANDGVQIGRGVLFVLER